MKHMTTTQFFKKIVFYMLLCSVLCPKVLLAFGEPPDFSKKDVGVFGRQVKPTIPKAEGKPIVSNTTTKNMMSGTGNVSAGLTDDLLKEQRKKASQFIQLKQYEKAKVALAGIPTASLTEADKKIKGRLMLFDSIESELKENNQMFKKDQTDPEVEKVTKRLYSGAQFAFLNEDNDLAKDLLIQTIFEDRSHFKAKKMLEYGYGMAPGSYQIENIEAKYWKLSLVNLYSGYPEKAVKNLKALEMFDPENPTVFERMGSGYYSMGEMRKAVEAWKRAAFLNPDNKELEKFIQSAEEEIKKQDVMALEDSKAHSKKTQGAASAEDMQLLRVVNDANTAYSYAQEVRKQMPGVNVVVEEADNGKWAVKIPSQKAGADKTDSSSAATTPSVETKKNQGTPQKRAF